MSKTPERTAQDSVTPERRLDSWKEIAAFLRRGIRTVQRWEREEGLPVHRLPHAERGSVYADPKELSAWWDSRQIKPEPKPQPRPNTEAAPRQRITNTTASTSWPALSSDARMVVYVSDAGKDGATPQIWLQQIGGAAMQLTTGLRDCAEPVFAADDTRVIFSAAGESGRNVYEVPAMGGSARVLKRMAHHARCSPDGTWLAYVALEPRDTIRLAPAAGGDERLLATGLIDVTLATWADDSRHLLVLGHPNPSLDLDYWVVPVDGGAPIATGVLGRARQQGVVVIAIAGAWSDDSIFFSAAARGGVHVLRQRISPTTFEPIGTPEMMTPGAEHSFYPTAVRKKLGFLGTHADTNLWSVAIDAASGKAYGPLRRLTRGPGIVSHLSLSQDGRTLTYFAARTNLGELRLRELDSDADTAVEGDAGANRGFPVISPGGTHVAYGTLVPGPPVQRPILLTRRADGDTRVITADCGGRPRQWLDERSLIVETFAAGLNAFVIVDTQDGSQRPFLSSNRRKVANPRLSPDGNWLAFDAMYPGGTLEVAIARITHGIGSGEAEWLTVAAEASHPFWSRDGRLLYFLPAAPNVAIRNRVSARRFDPSGRFDGDVFDVLTLTELIVPAMVTATGPITAPDQIIFVLGDYRGDVWLMDI